MKQLLLICAVVALVGCGESEYTNTRDLKPNDPAPEPVTETKNPLITNPILENAIRESLKKPTGELTKADYEKVTVLRMNFSSLRDVKGLEKLTQLKELFLGGNELTDVKGLEKLTQLEMLSLGDNQLTDVKGLEKLTQLKWLSLEDTADLTKAQIDELQKALPKCKIYSNPTK